MSALAAGGLPLTLQVSANLPGASPETMASNVASAARASAVPDPGHHPGATSNSSLGSTQIVLQFELNRNIDGAAQDVQAALQAAGGQLPTNLPSPPAIRKVNPADTAVLAIAMTSDSLPIVTVSDYANNIIAQQISRIDGVGLVPVIGARRSRPSASRSISPQGRLARPADRHHPRRHRQQHRQFAQGHAQRPAPGR